jgi:hypothetical protein
MGPDVAVIIKALGDYAALLREMKHMQKAEEIDAFSCLI